LAENEKHVPREVRCDRQGMPFCCGIEVIGNFNGGYRDFESREPLEAQIRRIHGILLATTVSWQYHAIRDLRARGFKPVLQFWNDVHAGPDDPKGNLVTLWAKDRGDGNMNRVGENDEGFQRG